MNEIIEDRVLAHLETIESVYGVRIYNKPEVAQWIGDRTDNEKTALTIATALNTWVLMNTSGGSVDIPVNVLQHLHDSLSV